MEIMGTEMILTIECPLCLKMVPPPLETCANGHKICVGCLKNLAKLCPNSNRLSCENLIFSCKNKQKGCNLVGCKMEMKYHYFNCTYKLFRCPRHEEGCKWKGPLGMITKHHLEIHSDGAFLQQCPLYNKSCDWKGDRTWLTKHFIENHLD